MKGVFGNVLVGEDFLRTMSFPNTATQGTMTSVYNLGCFFGALSTIYSGDILGRPKTILLGSSVIALGAIIQTASYSVAQMMVGRIVAGLGTGMNTATAGVWQAETSKMRSRGKLVIIQMANCITGFSISNWLRLGFSFAKGSVAWRFPLAFQICKSSMQKYGIFAHSLQSSPLSSGACAPSCPTLLVFSSERADMRRLTKSLPPSKVMGQQSHLFQLRHSSTSSKTSLIENI